MGILGLVRPLVWLHLNQFGTQRQISEFDRFLLMAGAERLLFAVCLPGMTADFIPALN
jgi:hypothetical protein